MMRFFYLLILLIFVSSLQAQPTFPYNGVADDRSGCYAFTNATIYTSYNQKIENATLVIRKGRIEAVGTRIPIPKDAVLVSCEGKTIYPSFIDLYASYGTPEPKAEGKRPEQQPQMHSNKSGAYSWNEALKPEFHAHQHFQPSDKEAKEYRELGFGTVLAHRMDGIARGTSSLVLLGSAPAHEQIVLEQAANHYSFSKGTSTQNYPSSLMGAIALLRQTHYDADWYQKGGREKEVNLSLEAWIENNRLPQIFETGNKLEVLRAAKVGKEFNQQYIFKTNGDSYQRLDAIKRAAKGLIVPLTFPDAFDVEDPYEAMLVTLPQLKHWELAPYNLALLYQADIQLALTSHGLEKRKDFWKNLRTALKNGLSEEAALKALTFNPAQWTNSYDQLGSLEVGKLANLIVVSGNVFDENAKILQNWIKGEPFVIEKSESLGPPGTYELNMGEELFQLSLKEQKGTQAITVLPSGDTTELKANFSYANHTISLSFEPQKGKGYVRLSGVVEGEKWIGKAQLTDGSWVDWAANYRENPQEESKKERTAENAATNIPVIPFPFEAYGWTERPQPATYLIQNATVWTNEAEGILENTDVLIQNGKIQQIGQKLAAKGATVIDGTGKHLTAGIIDEHSHIAVSRGVNEGTQASSAEVRIGDVVDSEDINIYRQLSGGVTTSQLLHGSANPIGGQSAIIKLRWGYLPDAMKFEGAAPFIKFALGENVKQSNWGEDNRTRFPQTRMGVEQIFENYFTKAGEYGALKKSGQPYRKDLELEALLEILNKERFITCHSYQQGEINMLMKVAERFDFRINTFTHILEGYKVADKMAEHGAGGSSFSDWWAYKFEVIHAIPYNGVLMQEQGVTVAFNSDDAEMARRLNQEAAKAVMYGGMSEEDALKLVTLNPAKLLHIDDRVGSIKAGKDGDVVLWSDHPLSIYAKAEKTFVDGIIFFDREIDEQLREAVEAERNALIQKMLKEKKSGGKTQAVRGNRRFHYHCDDMEDEMAD